MDDSNWSIAIIVLAVVGLYTLSAFMIHWIQRDDDAASSDDRMAMLVIWMFSVFTIWMTAAYMARPIFATIGEHAGKIAMSVLGPFAKWLNGGK